MRRWRASRPSRATATAGSSSSGSRSCARRRGGPTTSCPSSARPSRTAARSARPAGPCATSSASTSPSTDARRGRAARDPPARYRRPLAMLSSAVEFFSVMLALHIAAVVVAFGVTFAYPVIYAVAAKHPRHLPFTYRLEYAIGRRLITPGLLVVILAGAYLASKEDAWDEPWVIVPLVIAIVIGALGGVLFSPTERKIIEVAERDVAAAAGGEVTFSAEHDRLARRLQVGGAISSLLVLVAIYFMVTKPFA